MINFAPLFDRYLYSHIIIINHIIKYNEVRMNFMFKNNQKNFTFKKNRKIT